MPEFAAARNGHDRENAEALVDAGSSIPTSLTPLEITMAPKSELRLLFDVKRKRELCTSGEDDAEDVQPTRVETAIGAIVCRRGRRPTATSSGRTRYHSVGRRGTLLPTLGACPAGRKAVSAHILSRGCAGGCRGAV